MKGLKCLCTAMKTMETLEYCHIRSHYLTRDCFQLCIQHRLFVWHRSCSLVYGFSTKAAASVGQTGDRLEIWLGSGEYVRLLQGCVGKKSVAEGKQVHARLIKTGFESDVFLTNTLVNMYAKCGDLKCARQLFDKMSERNSVSWNSMIAGYIQEGYGEEALGLFCQFQVEDSLKMDQFTFSGALRVCASLAALEEGRQVHGGIIKSGFEADVFVGSALVDMYAKCTSIEDARKGFDILPQRDVVVWNAMVAGYAQNGHVEESLKLFRRMQWAGIEVSEFSLSSILRVCSSIFGLEEGKQVHVHLIKSGFENNSSVGSALVGMYAKCHSVEDARKVFDNMPARELLSWNAMSVGYVLQGHEDEALKLFKLMQQTGVKANQFILASVLSACTIHTVLVQGKQVHAHAIKTGFGIDVSTGTALVSMYAKYGFIEDARIIFNEIPERDMVLWNAMIAAFTQNKHDEIALQLFEQMQQENIEINQVTFVSVLNACASLEHLEKGNQTHAYIIKSGFELGIYVGSALVDMYAKCGRMKDAHKVFDSMPNRDLVSWTGMITGYAQKGYSEEALKVFLQCQQVETKLDGVIVLNILMVCANLNDMDLGMQAHAYTIITGIESSLSVGSALIDMYAKCGDIESARKLFNKMPEKDTVSWNAMIAGYAVCGFGLEAFKLFSHIQLVCMQLDQFTFSGILSACATMSDLSCGEQIHTHVVKTNFESDLFVGCNLLDMYSKCGSIDSAYKVFDNMPKRNLVSFNAMIAVYVQHELGEEALKMFCQTKQEGVNADQFSFASVLKACASLAALDQGKQVHVHIIKTEFESDVFVGSALVDMYAKCGSIDDAWNKFKKMPKRNVVSWNAMIAGYAQHGQCMEALQLFEQMQQASMRPNHITFISVLSSCSHVGLVDEGMHHFDSMNQNHCIAPRMEHYACIIDLLGRAGRLDEAMSIISNMPFEPDAMVWRTLLGACKIHGHIELGHHAGERLIELEPQDSAPYVLLSNIYAEASRWNDVAKLRKMMKDRNVRKEPGFSWIEINNGVHTFLVDD